MSAFSVTPDEASRYADEGFFCRTGVFGAAELDEIRAAAERVAAQAASRAQESDERYAIDGNRYVEAEVEAERATVQYEHADESATIRVIEPFHFLDPVFDGLVADRRILEPVCGVLGESAVSLWTDKLNLKRPREGSGFRWHQDSPYWGHACDHCDRLPNVMVVIDDADADNGCFRLIPRSHVRGFLPGIQDDTTLGPLFTDPAEFDETAQHACELPAGSLVFFDSHIVHGSQPNRSDRKRRAVIFTYQPPGHPMFKRPGERTMKPEASPPS